MKLVRTLCLLATGIAIAGFVQAESASIYMHIKKGGRPVHRSQAVTAEQADNGHVVIRSNPDIAIANVTKAVPAAKTATPEEQSFNMILPPNGRIVQVDDTKNEFYVLTEGEQEPVKPIEVSLRQHQMAVETQLNRVDTKESMWTISKPAHVDAILSQIAHKATVSEKHMNLSSAHKQTVVKPLFQAEKNGDVVDIEVALDKVFAEVDANNVMPLTVKKQVAKGHRSKPAKKLVSKPKKMPQTAMKKPQRKVAAASKMRHHRVAMKSKNKRQPLAMMHQSHMVTRRHSLVHVNA